MEERNSWFAPSIVALGLVCVAVALALRPTPSPSVTVGGDTITSSAPSPVSGTVANQFGSSQEVETDWTAGHFTEDLDVDRDSNVDGVETHVKLPVAASGTVTSVITSQLLTSLTNSGQSRRLMGAGCSFVPSAFGGNPRITISGGEEGATATGTGANLWYDNSGFALSTASSTLTATSTITGFFTSSTFGNVMWDTNEVIRFMVAAPTSSIRGNCYVW